jgi:L-aspartate oxidase
MALRAGAAAADVEFVQFHPTALHHPAMPRPLLSEALRGHGALLRDAHGERFVDELLPRDRVSRAITARMLEQGVEHVWLDATGLEHFAERFPTIATALGAVGLDPAHDWLPVAPAAHYACGGVLADLDGATTLPGLWVAGEVAGNGVHGANRLASNSLLDGMVFGPRVIEAVERGKDGPDASGAMRSLLGGGEIPATQVALELPVLAEAPGADEVPAAREGFQTSMTADAGVQRDDASLRRARLAVEAAGAAAGTRSVAAAELANLATVGAAVVAAALARTETRGAHTRADHPEPDPALVRRIVVRA